MQTAGSCEDKHGYLYNVEDSRDTLIVNPYSNFPHLSYLCMNYAWLALNPGFPFRILSRSQARYCVQSQQEAILDPY